MHPVVQHWISSHRHWIDLANDINKVGALKLQRIEDDGISKIEMIAFQRAMKDIPERNKIVLLELLTKTRQDPATMVDVFMTLKLASSGLKVYRPTLSDCFALEEIEIPIAVSDYTQPFDIFCIELPDQYGTECVSRCKTISEYVPGMVVVYHSTEAGVIMTKLITNNKGGVLYCGMIGKDSASTIEDGLHDILPGTNTTTTEEHDMNRRCVRIAINACLMLTSIGCKRTTDNQQRLDKLKRMVQNARTTEKRIQAISELKVTPIVYGFVQSVSLKEMVGGHISSHSDCSRSISPHWRRAHWRNQAYGPGRLQHRLKFIPHVLVNSDKFAGKLGDTTVTYNAQQKD